MKKIKISKKPLPAPQPPAQGEIERPVDPDNPLTPPERPVVIPFENPYQTPPYEVPPPSPGSGYCN